MAYLRPYRVAETSTTAGTGSITLAGAVAGYVTFGTELANADTATIVIEAVDANGISTGDWEICDTAFTSPDTLSRGTLRDSSTGSRIDFPAGDKRVFAINPRDVVDLGSADLIGTLAVADGGTGATDATGARSNLSAAASGANADITSMTGLTGGIATADFVTFDTAAAVTIAAAQIAWDADAETFVAGLTGAFPLSVGQQSVYLAKNESGGSIAKGRGVMFAGVVGGSGKLEYTNAVSNGTVNHDYAMGIAGQTVANGDFGYVIEFGSLKGIDTTGADKTVPETWLVGDFLYFDSAYPGELTNVEPIAPAWHSPIAVVTSVNATAGSLFVRVKTGERLGELHDVRINGTGAADGQVLRYDGTDERWENVLLTTGDVVGTTDTQTLTDKRINPRAVTASGTSGSLTPNGDTTDVYVAEGLTGGITLAQPSGTPVDGQKLLIRLEDDGTARAITWTTSAGAFREVGITLPTTTVATKITYVGCVYNNTDSFWDAIATVTQA